MANNKIAGGEIVWEGQKFNWGDEVPDELVAAHPEWVVDRPVTRDEIDNMSADEMKAALLSMHGLHTPEESVEAGYFAPEGEPIGVKKGGGE